MKTIEEKKAFALAQIKPYYKDPSLCGFENNSCVYITTSGKMCVVGKNLMNPLSFDSGTDFLSVFCDIDEQKKHLKPEACGILTDKEWVLLQKLHDKIASREEGEDVFHEVKALGLFTMEELEA